MEKRNSASDKWLSYRKQINKAYDNCVRPRTFYVGALVFKGAGHIQKGLNVSKFALNWEGLDFARDAFASGYYLISRPNSKN